MTEGLKEIIHTSGWLDLVEAFKGMERVALEDMLKITSGTNDLVTIKERNGILVGIRRCINMMEGLKDG